jgi:hypothetical protein
VSAVDLGQLAAVGYTVARGVAPEPLLEAARQAIAEFLGVAPDDPERWEPQPPLRGGVVPLHHAQAFWDLRQLPSVHQAFAAVRGTERLWVSMDRAIYKAPHPAPREGRVHWDLDPREHRWPSFQGMLFLTDTGGEQAPFQCVPSIYQQLDSYLASHPGLSIEEPLDLEGHELVSVPVAAGDLVLWDARLPHRGGPNRGRAPRLSVAVAMWPEGGEQERAERVACWQQKRAPPYWRGWPGQRDPEPGEPARLTELGRRLCGLERW